MVDVVHINARLVQLNQDAVAAAGISQQGPLFSMQGKAGVVAVNDTGVAGAKHSQFLHRQRLLFCI